MCQLGHHFYHQVPILHTSHGLLLRMWHMTVYERIFEYIRIFSSKLLYSYSIRGNFQRQILFKYSNIFVRIFPNIGLYKSLEILELRMY